MLGAFERPTQRYPVSLAIFDLDNTLIAGDSDHRWGEFLVHKNIVDPELYKTRNDEFYHAYQAGTLDIQAYLDFALEPFTRLSAEELSALRDEFMADWIQPLMLDRAAELLRSHRERGHHLLIITATNRVVTGPIAERLGVDELLATEAEHDGHRYTGKVAGTPCFREGKVTRLHQWLEQNPHRLEHSYFYSDSANDLPLLEAVGHPIAVDPDPTLEAAARERRWPIISLRS